MLEKFWYQLHIDSNDQLLNPQAPPAAAGVACGFNGIKSEAISLGVARKP